MKKLTLSIILILVAITASAQKFGVTGGLTMAQFDDVREGRNPGCHAGVSLNLPLALGFALQPELLYNVKGAVVPGVSDAKFSAGYCELGLQAQWGLDLIVAKPFILVEPYVGGRVNNFVKIDGQILQDDSLWELADRLECGYAIGGGIEVLYNLQLSVKHFRTLGTLFDSGRINPAIGDSLSGQFEEILDGGHFTGTTVSLTYFF